MSDKVKCRWPSCENDTDCMSGCKPAPPMTQAPSIKDALEDLQHFSDTQLDRNPKMQKVVATVVAALATLQPSGERREAIARIICYWDQTGTCHDNYCGSLCRAKKPNAEFFKAADAILASGLVQDEAAIRADERERIAKSVECDCCDVYGESPCSPKCANEIADAIRSALDGGEDQ